MDVGKGPLSTSYLHQPESHEISAGATCGDVLAIGSDAHLVQSSDPN